MSFPAFAEFFRAVNASAEGGPVGPFPWQETLAQIVVDEGWPDDIQVPTGLGKTAVIDVAVWVLASQASRPPGERSACTRTFLVVDRRLVVDQAFDRAAGLSHKLQEAFRHEQSGPVGEVARALAHIGAAEVAHGEQVLTVTRMRGGATWAARWIRRPDLPAVVVGTVDQLGSRVLFRGYGLGSRRLPIDAALVGSDALVIVDEVHLARPFVETTESAQMLEALAPQRVGRPARLVRMSATLAQGSVRPLVGAADRSHDVAGPRLRASKMARLVTTERKAAPSVMAALARLHLGTPEEARADSVAVVVNTVGLARDVFEELNRLGESAVLLIGRVRGFDRDRIAAALEPFKIGGRRNEDDPRVVVATQTIEVGVDLDVGALVVENAPLDSLVQRLGRLDRQGRRGRSELTIVKARAVDPVYGAPAAETWDVLVELAGDADMLTSPPRSLDDLRPPALDVGSEALDQQLAGVDRGRLVARTEPGPVVLPPMLDRWARTAPVPVPDEPVAEYLHGFERATALVAVAWRAVASGADGNWPPAFQSSLDAVSLRADEQVEVPMWEVIALLEGRDTAGGADVATAVPDEPSEEPLQACVRVEDGEAQLCRRRQDIRPGATLVLPSSAGGYDEWGWTGRSGRTVADVADLCRPGGSLRLDPIVLASLGVEGAESEGLLGQLRAVRSDDEGDPQGVREAVASLCADLQARGEQDRAPSELLERFRYVANQVEDLEIAAIGDIPRTAPLVAEIGNGSGVLVRWRESRREESGGLEVSDELGADDSERSTSSTGAKVELVQHSRAVGARAAEIARRIGLPDTIVRGVELAALAHDLGKGDPRFQLSLWGGDPLVQEADGRLLAKSDRPARRHLRSWPRGMRHEALSATLVEPFLDDSGAPDIDVMLVRHLVLAHHGHGRPLMPARGTGEATPFEVPSPSGSGRLVSAGVGGQVDWNHPQEFRVLCRRYGWWGLALLETIVRSADVCASEEGT